MRATSRQSRRRCERPTASARCLAPPSTPPMTSVDATSSTGCGPGAGDGGPTTEAVRQSKRWRTTPSAGSLKPRLMARSSPVLWLVIAVARARGGRDTTPRGPHAVVAALVEPSKRVSPRYQRRITHITRVEIPTGLTNNEDRNKTISALVLRTQVALDGYQKVRPGEVPPGKCGMCFQVPLFGCSRGR